MANDLRKVVFSLGVVGFDPDISPEEERKQERLTGPRKGFFHSLCKKEEISPNSGNFVETTYALVEDCETGEILYVLPELINFINEAS